MTVAVQKVHYWITLRRAVVVGCRQINRVRSILAQSFGLNRKSLPNRYAVVVGLRYRIGFWLARHQYDAIKAN